MIGHALSKRKIDSLNEIDSKKYKMSNIDIKQENVEEQSIPSYNATTRKIPQKIEEWLQMFHNWSHSERIYALDRLINSEICDVQQLRHLLALIEPQLQRDFISLLPKELSLYVLSFLEPPDLLCAAQTCRYWRILCEDNLLWREKCREEGLLDENDCILDFFRNRITATNNPYSINNSDTTDESTNESSQNHHDTFNLSDYKLAYLGHKSIEFNWRHGELNYNEISQTTINGQAPIPPAPENNSQVSSKPKTVTLLRKNITPRKLKDVLHLKGHEDHVITCLQFNPTSNIIVSGSDDNTLKVWSSITGRCLRTLNGHTGGVWSSQLSLDNIIVSGSTDRTLRVWNALNGQCRHVLYGHTSTVRCMALNGKHVVSGSRDATLRVWDIESGLCNHVLVGHLAAVRCVQFNGILCVSGAYDFLVKVWDVATETCLHTLEGHTNRVYSLQFDGIHIVSGSLDTSIRVWNADSGKLKHTLIGHQSLTSGMQLRNNILVSGNADSTVKVWDINSGQCLQTLSGSNKHQSAVTCLQFNSKFVVTSSDDGTVKLWDVKTGEFIRNLVSLPSGGSGGVVWRIRASNTKLVCAVGSRNGTEETKLLVLDFETKKNNYDADINKGFSNEFLFDDIELTNSITSDCLKQSSNCLGRSTFDDEEDIKPLLDFNLIKATSHVLSESTSTSSSALSSLSSTPSSSQIPSISSILPNKNRKSISPTGSSQSLELSCNDTPSELITEIKCGPDAEPEPMEHES